MSKQENGVLAGWASEDITPSKPVELCGQYYQRISTHVRDPLFATALALESAAPGAPKAQAILMSLDLVNFRKDLPDELRARLRRSLPDFDPSRLILNAIHTHNAPPAKALFNWWTPDPSAVTAEEYRPFLLDHMERAAVAAWRNRGQASAGLALEHASVGHCRRALYADGSAEMYGRTDRADFIGMEASEDSGVDLLFFWDQRGRPSGVVINLACPAQVMEATYCVTADYAGELRRNLKERISRDFFALLQIAPAGDQSPRDLARNYRGEPDMWNEPGAVEIGRRLADAVERGLAAASQRRQDRLAFTHTVSNVRLPLRRASEAEVRQARRVLKDLLAREPKDPRSPRAAFNRFVAQMKANERKGGPGPYDSKLHDFVLIRNNDAVVKRYEAQDTMPGPAVELHAIRLGDAAFATNPFELYLDYGQRIKARSKAGQTFLVQLSCDSLGYLPTRRAVAGGGYGALIINGVAGPDGGDVLVERTIKAINRLWS